MPWAAETPYPDRIDGQPAGPRDHAVFTGWVNIAGVPAINLPIGVSRSGLPIGAHLAAAFGADDQLLAFAREVSRAIPPPRFPRSSRAMNIRSPGRHFLQIPGPTDVPGRVLRAISEPTIDHRGPEFAELGRSVLTGLKRVFQTNDPVVIFPASGTGAWEAALVNTLSPGDAVADAANRLVRFALERDGEASRAGADPSGNRLATRRRPGRHRGRA